jgi:hypothetical protein
MSHRTRLIYRIPSFKEGITRIFDISGGIKDDFAVVAEKYDSVQEKDHDPLKEGDRAFALASEKITVFCLSFNQNQLNYWRNIEDSPSAYPT